MLATCGNGLAKLADDNVKLFESDPHMEAQPLNTMLDTLHITEDQPLATMLDTLPTEMLLELARHVDQADLCAFRLVCKATRDASHDSFVSTFFTTRAHLATVYSLQMLADITTHTSLVKYIKDITIVAPGLYEEDFAPSRHEMSKEFMASIYGDEYAASHYKDLTKETLAEQKSRRLRESAWASWQGTQSLWSRTGMVADLFAQTLDNLHSHGVSPAIHVRDCRPKSGDCFGAVHFHRHLAAEGAVIRLAEVMYGSCDEALPGVLTAIATSPLQVSSFSIHAERGVSHEAVDDIPLDLLTFPNSPFKYLKCLELRIGHVVGFASSNYRSSEKLEPAFGSAAALERLTLNFGDWSPQDWFWGHDELLQYADMIKACSFGNMTSIALEQMSQPLENIIAFLAPLTEQLRCFHLLDCRLAPGDRYEKLFEWLLQNTALTEIRLHELYAGGDYRDCRLSLEDRDLDLWVRNADAGLATHPRAASAGKSHVCVVRGLRGLSVAATLNLLYSDAYYCAYDREGKLVNKTIDELEEEDEKHEEEGEAHEYDEDEEYYDDGEWEDYEQSEEDEGQE
ncbi:hypothetical protein LTR56_007668 [Elasticomyces elasticus]|nr:hypothetical protein LTR56_007668 [Elasticomyces elasticus]KAK3665368.1 hypothetical protein LTR22_003891 [Elasticomyces elasticus]KAK5761121.1 hypothetical protein LTS12_008799 [Elasticomyces elasticus]